VGRRAVVRRYGLPVRRFRQLYGLAAAAVAPGLATRADVVHAHLGEDLAVGVVGVASARLNGLPLVVTIHTSLRHTLVPSDFRSWVLKLLGARLERWTIDRASAVIVLTPRLASKLVETGVPAARVHVIPSGVVPAPFAGPFPDPCPGVGRPRVVFLGRLARQKGVRTLMEAVPLLQTADVAVAFVGDGPERAGLEQLALSLGVDHRVNLTGFRAHDEVPAILAHADVLVLPSVYEELGSALLEGMQAGVPIVAARVGGIPHAVGDAAVLVPPEEPAALARAIDAVLADSALSRALSRRARERARAYDWDGLADRVLDVYLRAACPPPGDAQTGGRGRENRIGMGRS
jgi:glycosyltransferase involved in cell wall biosynthesis